jgi:hypothetical protein
MGSQGSSGLWETLEYVWMPAFKRDGDGFKYVQGAALSICNHMARLYSVSRH